MVFGWRLGILSAAPRVRRRRRVSPDAQRLLLVGVREIGLAI